MVPTVQLRETGYPPPLPHPGIRKVPSQPAPNGVHAGTPNRDSAKRQAPAIRYGPRRTRIVAPTRRPRLCPITFGLGLVAITVSFVVHWIANVRPISTDKLARTARTASTTPKVARTSIGTASKQPGLSGALTLDSLDRASRDRLILIDKTGKTLSLYLRCSLFPIATGKNIGDKKRVGDCRTPESAPGTAFPIATKQRTSATSLFGTRYMELTTPGWSGIAIHGVAPGEEPSIGTNASHGCVRLRNSDVEDLFDGVRPGDPVIIRP